MKQFAIIGLGPFGYRVVEELKDYNTELIIIDKDRDVIERLKDMVHQAYIVDVTDEEAINKLIPEGLDGAILDLGNSLEVAILVTNYLKKMGVKDITVKADTDKHGEILKLVGATRIVFPDLEAAKRLSPQLVSDSLYSYIPISSGLVMAEINVPTKYAGKTLIESNLRYKEGINVVAIKKNHDSEYSFFVPDYKLGAEDILLAVGEEETIKRFTSTLATSNNTLNSLMKKMFGR